VRIDGVFGVFVKGQEIGVVLLQMGGHKDLFVAHRKMHQAAFEFQQRFFGIAVFFVLSDGILDPLPGQRVLEFHCDDGDPVQKQHHVDGIFVFLAIVELPHCHKTVQAIQALVLRVHAAAGLVIGQSELCAPIFDAFAQGVQRAFLTDFPRQPGAQFLWRVRALLLLQLRVFIRLRGSDKVQNLRRNQAQVFVVVI
jgi:hypothetical protein